MIFYQLDYVVDEMKKNEPSVEQKKLKRLVGANFTKEEAEFIWEKIVDHKWYIGERLQRDIGLRVAAIDYVENFYEPPIVRGIDKETGFLNHFMQPLSRAARSYFLAKSKTLQSL